jgi:hypothetical protein
MTLSEQIARYHKQVQIQLRIEQAKQKFAEELDKHAARYNRNQEIIDRLKRVSKCSS